MGALLCSRTRKFLGNAEIGATVVRAIETPPVAAFWEMPTGDMISATPLLTAAGKPLPARSRNWTAVCFSVLTTDAWIGPALYRH